MEIVPMHVKDSMKTGKKKIVLNTAGIAVCVNKCLFSVFVTIIPINAMVLILVYQYIFFQQRERTISLVKSSFILDFLLIRINKI